MFKVLSNIMIIAAFVVLMTACTGTPYLNSHWGESVETAKALQTANPQAGQEPSQAPEMDGRAAGQSVDSYHRSFSDAATR
jgi:hypothetical protein